MVVELYKEEVYGQEFVRTFCYKHDRMGYEFEPHESRQGEDEWMTGSMLCICWELAVLLWAK